MKLYHYAKKENTILEDGLLSMINSPKDIVAAYGFEGRANSTNKEEVIKWIEKSFTGRIRSVSCLTETIKWKNNDPALKKLVEDLELFSFDLQELIKDGIIEAIYCKDGSDAGGLNENIYEVSFDEVDFSALPWHKCDFKKELFFAVIRHYFLVLKNGVIPPKYITKES